MPLLIPSIILRLRRRDPIYNARLRSWQVLDLCRGGRCHCIFVDGSIFNKLMIALDVLKCFQIKGIFGHPNSIGEISSLLNPWIRVRRFVGLTSK
jgi:hypothetical protein